MADNANGYVGVRGSIVLDFMRPVKAKDAKGKEIGSNLMYQLILPIGAPWETVYEVLDSMIAEIKKMQEVAIKNQEEFDKKKSADEIKKKSREEKVEPGVVDVEIEEN